MMNNSQTLNRAIQRTLTCAAALVAVAGTGATAWAQTSEGLEEIVVTAQKREQSLLDVPITVSVVSGDSIRQQGATDFDDLIKSIPGVTGFTTGVATSVWAIRGLSSNTSGSGGEPSVGFYQDGAYAGYIEFASMPLFDTNRVEVAKGPQGTLYGKNATAGAILVYNNQPDPGASTLDARVSAGNLGQLQGEIAGNLPVGEKIAVRVGGMYEEMDGWQKNMAIDSPDGGGFDRWGARVSALWNITDDFTAYAFYQHTDASGNGWMTNNQAITRDKNPNHVYSMLPESVDELETNAYHLQLDWQLNDSIGLKSITDYRDSEYRWEADAVAVPADVLQAITTQALRTPIRTVLATQGAYQNKGDPFGTTLFQQELRASYDAERFFMQGGVNYIKYEETRPQQAAVIHFAPIPQLPFRKADSTGFEATRDSMGVFVDGTYDVTDRLALTAGVRYSREEVESTNFAAVDLYRLPATGTVPTSYFSGTSTLASVPGCAAGSFTSPAAPCLAGLTDDRTDDGWTPRIAVNYRLTDNMSAYGSFAQGFKAGGFDIVTDGTALRTYEPENVDAFEVGVRGEYDTLRYGVAVFMNSYDDIQVSAIVNGVNSTRNAASAHSDGLESNVSWAPLDFLTLTGSYVYTDAEYDDGQVLGVPAKGLRLIRTPEQVVNVGVDLHWPVGNLGQITIAPSLHYQSEMELNLANRADFRQPSYTTVDGRIGFDSSSGRWGVTLYGENLTGEEILVRVADLLGFGAQKNYRPNEALYRLELHLGFGGAN